MILLSYFQRFNEVIIHNNNNNPEVIMTSQTFKAVVSLGHGPLSGRWSFGIRPHRMNK